MSVRLIEDMKSNWNIRETSEKLYVGTHCIADYKRVHLTRRKFGAVESVPTTVPIIATTVPAPTASQFNEELEEIRAAE